MNDSCMMCGVVAVDNTGGTCPGCTAEWDKGMKEAFDEMDRIQRKEALQTAFAQRCKHEDNRRMNRLKRWFYTMKAVICLLLNRRNSLWPAEGYEVSYFNYQSGYHYSWDEFRVGEGIFRNWHYDIYNNGD